VWLLVCAFIGVLQVAAAVVWAGGSFSISGGLVGLALSRRVASRRFLQWALRQRLSLCQGRSFQVCVVSLQSVGLGFLVWLPALCGCGRFCGWFSSVADVGFRRVAVRRGGVGGVACVLV